VVTGTGQILLMASSNFLMLKQLILPPVKQLICHQSPFSLYVWSFVYFVCGLFSNAVVLYYTPEIFILAKDYVVKMVMVNFICN